MVGEVVGGRWYLLQEAAPYQRRWGFQKHARRQRHSRQHEAGKIPLCELAWRPAALHRFRQVQRRHKIERG